MLRDDLEARARWHLEIGYHQPGEEAPAIEFGEDDEGDYLGHNTCWRCGGAGSVVTCMDDLCHGAGECMHGDGNATCRECNGEGVL